VPREGLLASLGLRPAPAARPTPRNGVERTPDARAFNAPLYLLSYLGKLIWRLVRESSPRLPARQAGTLATELTRQHPSGHGFRRRPIVAADFHPRSVSSTKVPCAGVACGIRTRVSTLKGWRPRTSRRTRLVRWCPRRRLLAALGLRPVAAQRPDRLRRSERTRGLPLTRRLLCPLSYEGCVVPLRLCPNASIPSDVVSRCTWLRPWAAHIPHRQHHVTRPRSERTHPKWSG
jgi:hypothetical protein